jgi:hypothetical protein
MYCIKMTDRTQSDKSQEIQKSLHVPQLNSQRNRNINRQGITISNIIKEWKHEIGIPNVEELRDFTVAFKKSGISIGQCAQGARSYIVLNVFSS